MDRRTFIKATGAAAAAAPLVSGQKTNPSQIKHVVVVMMENRSFDHLFGWLPNANGIQAGLTFPNPAGGTNATWPLAPDYTGCAYPDPDHSYDGGRLEYDNGLMDGFLLDTANGLNSIGYYTQQDLPFRSALALNYTTCDQYFPSILAPTFPNRIFQYAGQTDRLDDSLTISTLPTIWDNLAAAGVSAKYYFGNVPFLALWGGKYKPITHLYSEFLHDCAAGRLPAVSFVDPSFTILTNLQNDDHPFSDVRNGDAFLAQTFAAVSQSPNWANTAFIVNFDEWGGFYDHVAPPRALAPNNVDPDLVNGEALLGVRVPCIIASPWTKGDPTNPTVNHEVFDHTSVLKLIESVWNVPPLAARETSNTVGNLLDALNLSNPQASVPALPQPGYVTPSSLCFSASQNGTPGPDDETTVFLRMINSGMLAGFPGY
jgi:phospholipase C